MLATIQVLLAVALVGVGLPAGAQTRTGRVNAHAEAVTGASAPASPGSAWEIYDAPLKLAADALLAAKGTGEAAREATGFLGHRGFELKNLQAVRNQAATMNGRTFSGHALDQMQNRGVMPSVVENTIKQGQSFTTRPGTSGFFDSVNNVRVILNSETGQVVTVIRGAP